MPGYVPEAQANPARTKADTEAAVSATDPAVVTVRYWAAAAEAAGGDTETRRAGPVRDILASAQAEHPELGPVLAAAGVLLDGVQVSEDAVAGAGSTLEVLPPFAGG